MTTVLALAPLSSEVQEPAGDGVDARGQRLVGATHHRVLLMDQRRHLAPRCRIERRQRRIAAEAGDRRRLDPADQRGSLAHAAPDRPQRARQHDRVARAECRRSDRVHRRRREAASEPFGAIVGGKVHRPAARHQLMRQRLGRKQMSAGPACGKQDRALRHYSAGTACCGARFIPICVRLSGRLRVSASTMPIEIAIAIADEPP